MSKNKILVADDESRMRKLIKDYLVREDYEVIEAENGEQALDMFYMDSDISLIILDVMMPKVDGFAVLKEVRETSSIPVLMLTAKAEIDDKVLGLDSGANYYLTKPFDAKELLAAVRAITRSGNEVDTKLSCGNLTLDRASFELSTPQGSMKLANKEFQMMELLMAKPGNVISVDTFMDHIWGYDTDTESNVVWVYISYLRKKLAALGADVKIKASRNAGYSLIPNEG
jgi:DNA-binding response OmpR family regulator